MKHSRLLNNWLHRIRKRALQITYNDLNVALIDLFKNIKAVTRH